MSRPPRGLSPEEAELWARLAATVKPLHPRRAAKPAAAATEPAAPPPPPRPRVKGRVPPPLPPAPPPPAPGRPLDQHGLDSSWERKLARAAVAPDFTLDLHGHTLDTAHARLDQGLTQAVAMGARLVLLVTGKPRPSDDYASRGERRGAIRAKLLDWLAAGPHASRIAAVRGAHPRHGGAGAVYIVLRRSRD
ncbi:Smr/MutS family protein [Novosphingobium flavum]|uniref:Smr/MutS family protein n=1 Tax=Novosphingobium flavum TaxID=1778672 RepID=A0A7X1FTY7_9SPHN|nr:Smr/MutS family protein [Novosphingobium flavum]MBC2666940.1 Smr/MutS family protein [Novosphingobium flavum]